jgi:hypothetical protein
MYAYVQFLYCLIFGWSLSRHIILLLPRRFFGNGGPQIGCTPWFPFVWGSWGAVYSIKLGTYRRVTLPEAAGTSAMQATEFWGCCQGRRIISYGEAAAKGGITAGTQAATVRSGRARQQPDKEARRDDVIRIILYD